MRKAIQIIGDYDSLCALCDDGTIWHLVKTNYGSRVWEQLKNISQKIDMDKEDESQ